MTSEYEIIINNSLERLKTKKFSAFSKMFADTPENLKKIRDYNKDNYKKLLLFDRVDSLIILDEDADMAEMEVTLILETVSKETGDIDYQKVLMRYEFIKQKNDWKIYSQCPKYMA